MQIIVFFIKIKLAWTNLELRITDYACLTFQIILVYLLGFHLVATYKRDSNGGSVVIMKFFSTLDK